MKLVQPYQLLSRLGLSKAEIQVYLAMVSGSDSVREIMKTTGHKRPTVYYVLQQLAAVGLVSKTESVRGGSFQVEPVSRLEALAQQQLEEAKMTKLSMVDLIPVLQKKSPKKEKPRVAFFEGQQAVQNVIMESLYCKSRTIHSIAPHNNYFWQVGRSFVEKYVEQRYERKIKIFNLWEKMIEPKLYKRYYEGVAQVRILPKNMHRQFATTIFMFDDTVQYISSAENSYCLMVRSQEHYQMMRALFGGLWEVSQTHPKK